jgi:hypothetical protein
MDGDSSERIMSDQCPRSARSARRFYEKTETGKKEEIEGNVIVVE